MVRYVLIILFFLFQTILLQSQWYYNFGTSTGVYNTPNTASTTFLPAPPIGTARVRVSNAQGGSFNMENQSISFGSESYLRIVFATGTSVNKFSLYDYTPAKTMTMRFTVRFGASDGSASVSSGEASLFIGDGVSFSDNAGFSGGQVFAGLQFVFGSSGSITTSYRGGSVWQTSLISGTPFAQGNSYLVEIYCNNSTITENYTYVTAQSVAPNKFDLWVDGVLKGDDLPKTALTDNVNIDSWMFYGINSLSNAANIFIDDIYWQNSIASSPLPVVLSSFSHTINNRTVNLYWQTIKEINNSGFDIERKSKPNNSAGFSGWQKINFVRGRGNSTDINNYEFTDNGLTSGEYMYRLKQIDFNGNYEYFNLPGVIIIQKPVEFFAGQNYPNPSNPKTKIDYQIPFDGNVSLRVYDISGKEVSIIVDGFKQADYYTAEFDGSNLASGVYFYRITADGEGLKFTKTFKMILLK